MASFRYRAIGRGGVTSVGQVDAADTRTALAGVRQLGLVPVSVQPVGDAAPASRIKAGQARAGSLTIISQLSVLLGAGLQLERALALAIENIESPVIAASLVEILRVVREGAPLSRAMAGRPELFGAGEVAMAEAGEANGQLAASLARLAEMLEAEAELRRTIAGAMVYPIILTVVAAAVVLLMLLFVVPQFETVFASSHVTLPASSRFVMAASQGLRAYGLELAAGLVMLVFALRALLARPEARAALDSLILHVPQLGALIRRIETARLARTLGALLEGNVPVPAAMALAHRTIRNTAMSAAVGLVAAGIREGGGITAPLAASEALPRLAVGFFRTGEETAQLGPMLLRLADVLDTDIKTRLSRMLALLTPIITTVLGMVVAGIIASIMSAILGFNEMAVTS